ncbi:amidohydrolase [Flavipsychrobacter stenotrophus]|uniref:Amidohydrolase n=1 Tax=Flavipsychrobacter stenotrophus TaxID=2077091 RepID=A0A2S7SQW2_9BACT|nr:amidohydrolase family protein [Flavipsychrobacter stenotrophus]PQJ09007.1 amidohydrolase [Flavipsychrobacter stenotrophus]
MRKQLSIALMLALPLAVQAQDKKKWDVNNPGGPGKDVAFTVTEGTWMDLDVSPDGKEIAFDLLGDIYTLPIAGGQAKVLREGMAMEVQPRYSPDGKQMLFTSDAGGGDNIWVMNRDGSNAHQITKENFRLLNNGTWTPDGKYIIARKHFTSGRSLGAGELWMYYINGGNGLQLTSRKNDQQDLNEPSVSPDGRYVYYSEDMYPGGFFQYNKDPNNQIFVIKRFDREKGISETVTGGPGGALRPQISHDGKTMAFVKRVRTKTVLFLRNLETGEEWPIYDHLSKDQQEAWTVFGIYTGYAWMPDDKNIVIWSEGKIKKINVNGMNDTTDIPFTCNVKQHITDAVRFKQNLDQTEFTANVIRSAVTSPDGKWLVFNAVGRLWKKGLPDGKPARLTSDSVQEFEPAFSNDGKRLVYVTWDDSMTGTMKLMEWMSKPSPKTLTTVRGMYRTPTFSADGNTIVYSKDGSDNIMGNTYTIKPGIYTMPVAGSKETFITDKGDNPKMGKDGKRIYYQTGGWPDKQFGSCDLQGNDERTIFKSTYAGQFTVSPDNEWVAYVNLHQVYIAPFPHTGKPINLSNDSSDFPVRKVSRDAGINLHWSGDGKQLHYMLGDQYYTISLKDRFEQPDSAFVIPEKGISVGLTVKTDLPTGKLAFTHARIITMKGDEVIEDGTVVTDGNKIIAVGSAGSVTIPARTKEIDCKGKTIMPGFIDAHAHGAHFRDGLTPGKHWPYYTNLAYGVTTMHDPSANSELVFAQSELVKAGLMVGPRQFSTGTILYGADGDFKAVINNYEDAKSALRRTKAFGAFSVKSYNQPRREQRQMVIEAARELGMEVVPEGGSFYNHNLSMIMDGHTTVEHNIPVATLYDDVVQFWKRAQTANTPTLIVSYGALSGEYYWYQHTDVWAKERLLRFTPRAVLDTRSRHRTMAPEEEYENGHMQVSRSLKKLADAGVTINMGAHGQIQGIGAHWEIWMLAQGGMTPMQALHCATINSATSLGLDNWIGSLQVGKFADLIIMDKNPLENIYNTESVHYTMINGRLYDCETMNEIGNYNKPRTSFYWENSRNASSMPWYAEEREIGE